MEVAEEVKTVGKQHENSDSWPIAEVEPGFGLDNMEKEESAKNEQNEPDKAAPATEDFDGAAAPDGEWDW